MLFRSINIGIDGNFAPWVGALIPDIKQQILIITEPSREEEVVTRLARVGYDYTIGYLEGGYEAWEKAGKETDHIRTITVEDFAKEHHQNPNINVVDVRKHSEYESEHIEGALNMPLDFVNDAMYVVNRDKTYYVHCAGGYRSMIFNSILRARGYDNLIDVQGGMKAIRESGEFKVTDFVEPVTML